MPMKLKAIGGLIKDEAPVKIGATNRFLGLDAVNRAFNPAPLYIVVANIIFKNIYYIQN